MRARPPRLRLRPVLAVGVAVAAAYATVHVATMRLDGSQQRPLFDGFAPSTPYRWVDPPPEFEAGNVEPNPSTVDLPIDPDGFHATGATTEDGQLVLNLPDGAVAPRPGDTEIRIVIRPLAPARLGPLPAGLFADGNAYRVELSYRPSGQVIDTLAQPGNIALTVPEPAVAIVHSSDGRVWQRLETATGQGPTTSPVASFSRGGHYLGAADHPTAVPDQDGSGDTATVVLVVVLTAALVVALVVMPVLVRRARRRPGEGRRGKGARSRTPPARKAGGAKSAPGRQRTAGSSRPKSGGSRSKKKKKKR